MAKAGTNVEVEIKLRVADLQAVKRKLAGLGYKVAERRALESNTLFDRKDGGLRMSGQVVRLRSYRGKWILTYKGAGTVTEEGHKARPEYETELPDPAPLERVLGAAGLSPSIRYEKYRTGFRRPGAGGVILIDETPAGDFLELEGGARWIDRTARELGYSPEAYITDSYLKLFFDERRRKGLPMADMLFGGGSTVGKKRKTGIGRTALSTTRKST